MSGRVQIDSAIMPIERPSDVVQRRPAAQPVELNVTFLEACQRSLPKLRSNNVILVAIFKTRQGCLVRTEVVFLERCQGPHLARPARDAGVETRQSGGKRGGFGLFELSVENLEYVYRQILGGSSLEALRTRCR